MRVLVCGGRFFIDVPKLWRTLDRIDRETPITFIMEGASDDVTGPYTGADYWTWQWALARNKPLRRFHAAWGEQGRAAGPIRNREMERDGKPDVVVSFPGGRGTRDMVERATLAGIRVITVS